MRLIFFYRSPVKQIREMTLSPVEDALLNFSLLVKNLVHLLWG